MIAKPLRAVSARNPAGSKGWEAERQMAFYLARAFEPSPDVVVFNGLRFAVAGTTADDFAQIDHLVLHRHGIVIVESKSTGDGTGEFHVDALGQWTRRPQGGRGFNMTSPLAQAQVQAEALRRLLSAADPPLLDKVAGLVQQHFRNFPIIPVVAICDKAKLAGIGAAGLDCVMKAERVAEFIRAEIDLHHKHAGVVGALRSGGADRGVYTLTDAALERISKYLLAKDHPIAVVGIPPPPQGTPVPCTPTGERLEALTCRHCRSIRVAPVYRKDYCLLCDECGRYTPLDRACVECGKPSTIRKRGDMFLRSCDKAGGCGAEVVFWRSG